MSGAESLKIFNSLPSLIEKTFPMPGRFHSALPSQVAELSRLLTGARRDRSLSYLSRPNYLSAYLRYFLPWNIMRLCRLLPFIELPLRARDVIADLGSGPLTFVSALWLSRPDLRSVPLEFFCIDNCAPALAAGKKFFAALTATSEAEVGASAASKTAASTDGNCAWKVNTVKEKINLKAKTALVREKAALVCAVNLFNEMYEDLPHTNSEALKRMAENAAYMMRNQAKPDARILTVEPGVPQSGHFISFLRAAFLEMNRAPLSPCTHSQACPMPGGKAGGGKTKARWCHFAFDTTDAPKELSRLSSAAGIPKERLVLSYLLVGAEKAQAGHTAQTARTAAQVGHTAQTAHISQAEQAKVRVISDAFPLPGNKYGRYGCSPEGLVLVTGDKTSVEKAASGELVQKSAVANARDPKSGALIMEIK